MEKSKKIFYITLLMIVLIITIPTIIRINEVHQERLMRVETLKIKEGAFKCYLKKDCLDKKIYLTELIEKKYLIRGIDPRTDEYFNDDIYVLINNDKPSLYLDNKLFE